MQQQINLYQEQFHIRKAKGPGLLLWGPVGFIAVLLLISAFEYWTSVRLENRLQEVSAEYEQLQAEMDRLQLAVKQRSKDPALERKMLRLDRELRRKRKSLELLAGDDAAANKQGLSEYLVALSEIDQEELWLEHISIQSGGLAVELRGKTIKPEEVPVYLQDLGQFSVYEDKAFRSFILARDEERRGLNHFLLSTSADGELELEQQP
jgi:hypothetical protein